MDVKSEQTQTKAWLVLSSGKQSKRENLCTFISCNKTLAPHKLEILLLKFTTSMRMTTYLFSPRWLFMSQRSISTKEWMGFRGSQIRTSNFGSKIWLWLRSSSLKDCRQNRNWSKFRDLGSGQRTDFWRLRQMSNPIPFLFTFLPNTKEKWKMHVSFTCKFQKTSGFLLKLSQSKQQKSSKLNRLSTESTRGRGTCSRSISKTERILPHSSDLWPPRSMRKDSIEVAMSLTAKASLDSGTVGSKLSHSSLGNSSKWTNPQAPWNKS